MIRRLDHGVSAQRVELLRKLTYEQILATAEFAEVVDHPQFASAKPESREVFRVD